jgi:hypothetical protein
VSRLQQGSSSSSVVYFFVERVIPFDAGYRG